MLQERKELASNAFPDADPCGARDLAHKVLFEVNGSLMNILGR
jgi:hypothetical protein